MLLIKRNIKKVYSNGQESQNPVTEVVAIGRIVYPVNTGRIVEFNKNGHEGKVLTLRFAINNYKKDEEAAFYDLKFFDKNADIMLKLNLDKGSKIAIVGVMNMDEYDDKNGSHIIRESIVVDSFEVIDFKHLERQENVNNEKPAENNNQQVVNTESEGSGWFGNF